jgi:hypothetical protein
LTPEYSVHENFRYKTHTGQMYEIDENYFMLHKSALEAKVLLA